MLFILFHQQWLKEHRKSIEAANEIFKLINDNNKDIQNEYFKKRLKERI